MSAAVAQFPSRFVRRTTLAENEYRVNFKQIDNEVIRSLVSPEARAVTPQMSTIYLSLLAAPQHCWERNGVIHFVGEDRENGHLTAWEQMREIAGVANSTLSKAMDWMHRTGVIGYDARANGVGIRIFFNRASASIRSKPARSQSVEPPQKNLRIVPTPTAAVPTPTDGMGFMEKGSEKDREKNTIRAFAREENPIGEAPSQPGLQLVPPVATEPSAALIASLTRQITIELRPEIADAIKRESNNTREWFLNHGLPKATRVAQRETYDLLRAHGMIAKKTANSGEVGRYNPTAEQGREGNCGGEGKSETARFVAILAETATAIQDAAAKAMASGSAALHTACQHAGRTLRELYDQINAGEHLDLQEIETKLAQTDADLANALWDATGESELAAMLKSARADLQDYATRMEKEIFDDTIRRHVINRLRERYNLPRISLFYL